MKIEKGSWIILTRESVCNKILGSTFYCLLFGDAAQAVIIVDLY